MSTLSIRSEAGAYAIIDGFGEQGGKRFPATAAPQLGAVSARRGLVRANPRCPTTGGGVSIMEVSQLIIQNVDDSDEHAHEYLVSAYSNADRRDGAAPTFERGADIIEVNGVDVEVPGGASFSPGIHETLDVDLSRKNTGVNIEDRGQVVVKLTASESGEADKIVFDPEVL